MLPLRLPTVCLVLLVAACGADSPGGDEPADAHPAHAQLHGQDDRGFVLRQVSDELHPGVVEFGVLEVGERKSLTAHLENVERGPITITSVTAGCSCTLPEISYVDAAGQRVVGDMRSNERVLVVPPGRTADLEIRVDSALAPVRNRDKVVLVRVVTDSDLDPYITIEARMRIEAAFQAAPPEISLGRIGINSGAIGATEIAPIGDSRRTLVGLLESPRELQAEVGPSGRQGTTTWLLAVAALPPLEYGYQERAVRLTTSGPDGVGEGRPFEVKVRWTGADDVEVVPNRLMFMKDSGVDRKERAQVELLAHTPGQRLMVVRHELQGENAEHMTTRLEPDAPDEAGRSARWRITLEPEEELGQRVFNGTLVLELDDPQYPRFEVPVLRRGVSLSGGTR